ncbi:MAG: HlyD family secretion protein, partial [Coraliomargarita sp.]|nr:HlyD family secretion protein [Coraliomargarita sp.]
RDWLRQSQRFPVVVKFDPQQGNALIGQIRIGGQATVIAYSSQTGILATLGRWYIRLQSWLSYAY